jgi:hypothetical protein
MHQRMLRGLARAALVIVIVALALAAAATSAEAWTSTSPGTVQPGDSFGVNSCPQLSGPTFIQQGDSCFYFPNGSSNTPATCDPSFCGQVHFLFPSSGTFTATLTYPAPNGFNLLGLQLCHNGQAVPDPANCPQTMAPGGADVPGCVMDVTTNDNGTPLDASDDTATTTLTCPIPAGDSLNQYTLIVYPLTVLNCADVMDPICAADFTQGVTAALSGTFTSTVLAAGPEGAKASGGGEVAPKQNFSLHAENTVSKWDNAHVRFAIASNDATRCKFEADGATYVDVEPTPLAKEGGTAIVSGTGTVTDFMKVKHNVTYQLQVSDGGKNGTDTFQLTAPGCDTHGLAVPVTHGNIVIHPGKSNN